MDTNEPDYKMLYLALRKACDDAEPVGYRYVDHNGHWCFNEMKFGDIAEPVYSHPAPVIAREQKPVARVDANDDCCWADMLPDNDVIIGQLLYSSLPNTAEIEQRVAEAFVTKFKRHVGGDGEFWLHELEDFCEDGKWREYL